MEELDRLDISSFKEAQKIPVVVVLDNLRSGHNVGSFFRTGDAFLLQEIHLCGYTPTPPNKEIRKTALGATESVAWKYFKTTHESIESLHDQGYTTLAVEQTANSQKLGQFMFHPKMKYALVFGNEVRGVDQEIIDLCNASLEIEQQGTKHSFNVSVCGGIVLWEVVKALQVHPKSQ